MTRLHRITAMAQTTGRLAVCLVMVPVNTRCLAGLISRTIATSRAVSPCTMALLSIGGPALRTIRAACGACARMAVPTSATTLATLTGSGLVSRLDASENALVFSLRRAQAQCRAHRHACAFPETELVSASRLRVA